MKISSFFLANSDRLFERHLAKQHLEEAKYVRIPLNGLSDEYFLSLRNSASTLANYLKHHKMALAVTSEKNLQGAGQDRFIKFSLLDLKNKEKPLMSVSEPDKPKKIYHSYTENRCMIPILSDGLEVVRNVSSSQEANLTQHIYRLVSDMVEKVKNIRGK